MLSQFGFVGMKWMKKTWVSIPDVLFFQEGPGVRNTQYTIVGVKLLNVANLVDGKIDLSTSDRYISEKEAYGKYKHFLCDAGDFIIASSGIKVEYIDKKMGFVDESMLPLCMNTSTIRFKVLDEKQLRIRYFMYYLKSEHFKQQLFKQITGSAQLNYGPSHLKKMIMPLIDLNDQDEIVSCMDKVQNIIEKRQQELYRLDDLIKARFVEMFGNPRLNEKGFKCKKGFELFKISNGKAVSNEKRFESGIPAYGGNGISWYTNTVLFEEDTIVIGRVGFQSGNVHFVKGPMWITDNAMYISELYDDSLSLVFLCDMMEQIDFTRDQDAGDLKKVTQKPFMEMEYILPEKSLQKEYIDFVHQVDKSKFMKSF